VDEIVFATDDGSKGMKGPVSLVLEAALEENSEDTMVYACGPKAMLSRVSDLCELYGVSCELSLEAFMACGIGACHGCVVAVDTETGQVDIQDGLTRQAEAKGWEVITTNANSDAQHWAVQITMKAV